MTPDPEIEWLAARLLGDHVAPDPMEPWATLPDYVRDIWRTPARTALTIVRERYILVPREGAEEARELASPSVTLSPEGYAEYAEDMGAEARPMPRSRAVVYGPWQSDAEAVPDLMAALHASVVRARAARTGETT